MIKQLINKIIHWQYLHFAIVGAIGTLVSMSILYALTEWVHLYYIISFIVGTIAGSIINYILNKKWVFKNG